MSTKPTKPVKKPAPKLPARPARPTAPPPDQPVSNSAPKKPKPAPVVEVEPVLSLPTLRGFGDPPPEAPEPVVVSAHDGPVHRAPCDPPSRT